MRRSNPAAVPAASWLRGLLPTVLLPTVLLPTVLLPTVLLLGALGCGAPAASLDDGAAPEASLAERLDALRAEVAYFEGRRVLERDGDAIARMAGWLEAMADSSEADAEVYEQAVRAQLEYLRSEELRYYPDEATR